MSGLGIGIIFIAYGFGLWGYCMLKDYDVNIYQLFDQEWPPPKLQKVAKKLGENPSSTTPGGLSLQPLAGGA